MYVLPAHRGAGLGQAIVAMMIEDGPGAGWRWMLHTSDAHGLYRRFGFAAPDGRYLERPPGRPEGPEPAVADPLTGEHVRLEPLRHDHVPGLVAAAAGGGDLYRWTACRGTRPQARRYVETAVAARDAGLRCRSPWSGRRRHGDRLDPVLGSGLLAVADGQRGTDPTRARSATPGWPGRDQDRREH